MKRITRIIISFCLMLLLTEGVKGQSVRIGVEGNYGVGPYYKYDSSGFFEGKEKANMLLWSANFYYDIIFPRSWTPNWMALSMQIGFGTMQLYCNDSYIANACSYMFVEYGNWQAKPDGVWSRGVNLPVGFDVKFLMSDNVRFFINGGVLNYLNTYDNFCNPSLDFNVIDKLYVFGYNYGCGFEFGPLRMGYKLTSFPKMIFGGKRGNQYDNIHTISLGIMFNGNRFLKRNSHLKVY